jgi:hypothetical protein
VRSALDFLARVSSTICNSTTTRFSGRDVDKLKLVFWTGVWSSSAPSAREGLSLEPRWGIYTRSSTSSPRPQVRRSVYVCAAIWRLNRCSKADSVSLQAAYRSLALLHTDKTGGSSAAFLRVNAAYEVLSDSLKRWAYDQYGMPGVKAVERLRSLQPHAFVLKTEAALRTEVQDAVQRQGLGRSSAASHNRATPDMLVSVRSKATVKVDATPVFGGSKQLLQRQRLMQAGVTQLLSGALALSNQSEELKRELARVRVAKPPTGPFTRSSKLAVTATFVPVMAPDSSSFTASASKPDTPELDGPGLSFFLGSEVSQSASSSLAASVSAGWEQRLTPLSSYSVKCSADSTIVSVVGEEFDPYSGPTPSSDASVGVQLGYSRRLTTHMEVQALFFYFIFF